MAKLQYDELKICARCRQPRRELTIRRCPNEAVNRVLGEYICVYCCKKCRFHTTVPLCGAIGCELWRKEEKK